MNKQKLHILIVEDHESSVRGISDVLVENDQFDFIIEVRSNADEAYLRISEGGIDIVILDLHLETDHGSVLYDGDDLLMYLNKLETKPPVIVFSKSSRVETLDHIVHNLGIDGYILKGRGSLKELIPAIQTVLESGKPYLSEGVKRILSNHTDIIELDRVDRLILKSLARGFKQNDIPNELQHHDIHLSVRALEKRISRMKLKFGVEKSMAQLIYEAVKEGILRVE